MSVVVGVSLVGAVFYGLLTRNYISSLIGRTLGPYTDALAAHIFDNRDPEVWRSIAATHGVTLVVRPAGGEPLAFDASGARLDPIPSEARSGEIGAARTAGDGSRVVVYWPLWSFQVAHYPLLAMLVIVLAAVVGSVFLFLQRQLKPLGLLRGGVEAVAGGDFAVRVPVVREDEIGQVAVAFNAMASRVGGMMEERERLLADVSHELRSPIARMKVALELVPEGGARHDLDRDLREMESLITALLEREGLRSGGDRIEIREVDLGAIAREAAGGFEGRGPGFEIVTAAAPVVRADPSLMRLLFRNLFDNAIKFSRPDSGPVIVTLEADTGRTVVKVADDGIGIPQGDADRLFEPFVKLDKARGHHAGYGLGLDLCRRIVRLHGGTIRLLPREPRGTEAVVILPRRQA